MNLRPRTRQILAYGSLGGLVMVSVAWVLLLWFDKNPEGLTPVLATWTGVICTFPRFTRRPCFSTILWRMGSYPKAAISRIAGCSVLPSASCSSEVDSPPRTPENAKANIELDGGEGGGCGMDGASCAIVRSLRLSGTKVRPCPPKV